MHGRRDAGSTLSRNPIQLERPLGPTIQKTPTTTESTSNDDLSAGLEVLVQTPIKREAKAGASLHDTLPMTSGRQRITTDKRE